MCFRGACWSSQGICRLEGEGHIHSGLGIGVQVVRTVSFAVDTVTANLLIQYIWVLEVSLIEGQNSLWLYARGLQMGFVWLDKDNQHMLFSK